jgi:MoaA/NifB/PqqE/SkfB family radical SAM enzyme
VKISWNGATKETHESIMLGADFDEMLSNVQTLIEVRDAHFVSGGNRCRVTFQLTFLESNVEELADMVRLAIGLGVDRIKGHHLWAHFGEIEELSMRRNADAIQRWNAAVSKARTIAMEHRLPNGQHILLENLNTLETNASDNIASDGVCPFLGQEAWVSATGRFDPCCAPDAQRRTLGEFGDLHKSGLIDIWTGHAYQELKKSYLDTALCQGCNMRKAPVVQL